MTHNRAYPISYLNIVRHEKSGMDIPTIDNDRVAQLLTDMRNAELADGNSFIAIVKHIERINEDIGTSIFKVSILDIDKALQKLSNQHTKSEKDLKNSIPAQFHDLIALWKSREAAKLPPHRPGVDHKIELKRNENGTEMQVPFGPLYDMSREELLVLSKTLNDLLDKGYIQASKSEAGAPVLFARKPGGGLRFCCDYRGLNAATKSDRYPLPL
ncbi:hypothetical protein K3495_g16727, partial [Podosphaera aphanis]